MNSLFEFRFIENRYDYDEFKVVKYLIDHQKYQYIHFLMNYEITEGMIWYAIYYENIIFLKYFHDRNNEIIGPTEIVYAANEKRKISLQFILEMRAKDIPLFMFRHRLGDCELEYRDLIEFHYENNRFESSLSMDDDSSLSSYDFSEE
jgi:hypothetical protein